MQLKSKPFFSVVIPALNEEYYLPKLLSDFARQTDRDFEVIIIDGKSEDQTVKKAKKLESKLPSLTIFTGDKRGVSHQRNLGAAKAKGEWILFMDADNRIPGNFLEKAKAKIELYKPQVFTCWSKVDSTKPEDKLLPFTHNLGMDIAVMLGSPTAYGAMIGFKKNDFAKIGGFDETMKYSEDTELIQRAYKNGLKFKVFHNPKYVYSLRRYRKKGTLKTISDTIKLHLKNFIKLPVDQAKEYPMGGEVKKKERISRPSGI